MVLRCEELAIRVIKNLLCFFLFNGFITVCKSLKALDTCGILSTPASDVHVRLKTIDTAIEIARKTTNSQ